MASKQEKKEKPQVQVTVAEAFRDVFVTSIDRGQFLTAIFGLILIIVVWRLPSNDLVQFVRDIIQSLKDYSLLGYFLFILTVVSWYIHWRFMRSAHLSETQRIGEEKSKYQKELLGADKVLSSNSHFEQFEEQPKRQTETTKKKGR